MSKTKTSFKNSNVWVVVAVFAIATFLLAVLIAYGARQKSSDDMLEEVSKAVTSTYANIAVNNDQWVAQMGSGVPLWPIGYAFGVSSKSLPSIHFGTIETALEPGAKPDNRIQAATPDSVLGVVTQTLTDARYTIQKVEDGAITFQNEHELCIYTSETLTCYRDDMVSAAAGEVQPFYEAIVAHRPESALRGLVIGPAVVKSQNGAGVIGSSHEAGYDIAEVLVREGDDEYIALFYNKSDGPWVFVAQAGDEYGFSCTDMATNYDVRKAFYDQICLSESGHVRLDTANPALQ